MNILINNENIRWFVTIQALCDIFIINCSTSRTIVMNVFTCTINCNVLLVLILLGPVIMMHTRKTIVNKFYIYSDLFNLKCSKSPCINICFFQEIHKPKPNCAVRKQE